MNTDDLCRIYTRFPRDCGLSDHSQQSVDALVPIRTPRMVVEMRHLLDDRADSQKQETHRLATGPSFLHFIKLALIAGAHPFRRKDTVSVTGIRPDGAYQLHRTNRLLVGIQRFIRTPHRRLMSYLHSFRDCGLSDHSQHCGCVGSNTDPSNGCGDAAPIGRSCRKAGNPYAFCFRPLPCKRQISVPIGQHVRNHRNDMIEPVTSMMTSPEDPC